MSSLWTPSGERPVGRPAPGAEPRPERDPAGSSGGPGPRGGSPPGGGPQGGGPPGAAPPGSAPDAGDTERLQQLRAELANAPADVVVANHCFGLFELAAVYLSQSEPRLDQARLAIDALGLLVDGLAGRLGEPEPSLKDALAQLRLAYVQIDAAHRSPTPAPGSSGTAGARDGAGGAAPEDPADGPGPEGTATTS